MKKITCFLLSCFVLLSSLCFAAPPSFITITSPQDGSYVNNIVLIEAQLTQIPRVRSVKFYIDDIFVEEDTTSPYQYTWDTTAYSDGQHTIYASILQTPKRPVPFEQENLPVLDSPKITVTVDNTPPSVSIIAPLEASFVTGTITTEANVTDNFGISKVEFKIDNNPIKEFTQPPYTYQLDTTTFQDRNHTFTVIAYDLANNKTIVSTNFTVDNSPPSTPIVTDDGQYTNSLNTLHATWTSNDPQSGIIEYQYSIGTIPGAIDIVNWISVGIDTETVLTNLTLTHGKTYYFNVKAINGADLVSIGSSDGITTNAHIPQITRIIPSNNSTLYVGSLVTIEAGAQDLDSDPLEYQFLVDGQVRQSWSSLNTFNWTVEPSSSNTHLITIQVRDDKGGFVSEDVNYNIQIAPLDATPPTPPVITVAETSNSLESISASWTSEDPESGIIEYQYAIGATPGGTDIIYWTSSGTNTEAFISGLKLTKGQVYYLSVVAKNGAGLKSQATTSSAIRATKEPRLKITWPQDNAIITYGPIEGIAEGIDQVTINGKAVTVNPDETFQAPTLIAPGYARRGGITEDNPNYIIMNFPGPTTITAIANGQIQTITVYCHQVFVKRDYLTWWNFIDGSSDVKLSLYQYQTWNTSILVQPPFSDWAAPNYDSRNRAENVYPWGYSYPWTYYNAANFQYPHGFADSYVKRIATSPSTSSQEATGTTQMTIHTLPAIDGQVQPMTLVFKNCDFATNPPDFSQYRVNGHPLKMLYEKQALLNTYYIVLTDYQPDSDLELYVTMPTYEYTTENFGVTHRHFMFEDIDVLRLETVREMPYNSGNYFAVKTTPIFQPDDGKGRGPCLGLVNIPYLTVMFGEDLSSSVINTVQVSLKIADAKKTYSLIETSADSGVFTEPTNSFILRLDNPSIQLNSNIQDEITCFVTSTTDNIIEQVFNLKESASDSLYFNDVKTFVTVTFNQELLPYQIDTLTLYYTNGLLASEETLTETTPDSLVFTNPDNTFTITLNNYQGTMPDNFDITIQNQDYLELMNPRLLLAKVAPDSYVYTNEPIDAGSDLPPNSPLDDGQGVFKIRVKGLGGFSTAALATLPVTVATDIESKTLTLTRQPDGSYMTDRVVLLPEDDATTYDGIYCLRSTSGEGKLEVKINEDNKQNLDVSKAAFVGSAGPMFDWFGGHWFNRTGEVANILRRDLGYPTVFDAYSTKKEFLKVLPDYSILHFAGHGGVANGLFVSIVAATDFTALQDPLKGQIFPNEIKFSINDNKYDFVFINSCLSADENSQSNTQAFIDAFNARTYYGWTISPIISHMLKYAKLFYRTLDGKNDYGDPNSIKEAREWLIREYPQLKSDKAKYYGDENLRIDKQ